jgi:phosphoribosylamine--glycine ligase
MVIEYNVRMGDPETEAVMLRIDSDLVELMQAAAKGNLGNLELKHSPKTAVTVMAVSEGYPGSYPKGRVISGLEDAKQLCPNTIVFHAGTALAENGDIVTSGGRVLTASSIGDNMMQALERSYEALGHINFQGKYSRRDIGQDLK